MSDAPKRKAGDEPQAAEAAKKTKEEEAASTETEETKEDASSSSSNKTKATTRDSPCTGCGTTDFEAWIHCDSCASRVCSACDPQKRICSVEGECGVVCCGDCRSGGDAEWVPCDECGQVVCTSCMDSGTKVLGEAAADMAITVPPSFKLCLVCIQEDALETIVQKFAGGSCRMCSKPSGEAQCDLCEASFCHSCSTNLGEPGSDAVKRIAGDAYGRGHLVHTCDGCDVLICQNCATGKNYKGGGVGSHSPSMWCGTCEKLVCYKCAFGDKCGGKHVLLPCMVCGEVDNMSCLECIGQEGGAVSVCKVKPGDKPGSGLGDGTILVCSGCIASKGYELQ